MVDELTHGDTERGRERYTQWLMNLAKWFFNHPNDIFLVLEGRPIKILVDYIYTYTYAMELKSTPLIYNKHNQAGKGEPRNLTFRMMIFHWSEVKELDRYLGITI